MVVVVLCVRSVVVVVLCSDGVFMVFGRNIAVVSYSSGVVVRFCVLEVASIWQMIEDYQLFQKGIEVKSVYRVY